MSNPIELVHDQVVKTLNKQPELIRTSLSNVSADLWHQSFKIMIEAAELADAIKKVVIYNQELDIKNVIEELGDLEFHMKAFRQVLNITRDETLQANCAKLAQRYKDGYSDKAAQERADKILPLIDGDFYYGKVLKCDEADLVLGHNHRGKYNERMGGFEILLTTKDIVFVDKENFSIHKHEQSAS